jgi:hypothetical protein
VSWPYPSRRERLPVIEALLEEGYTRLEAAHELGISRGYLGAILTDPDGVQERRRKDGYRGVCGSCGGPTDGSNGPGKAPGTCMACIMGGAGPTPASPPRERSAGRRAEAEAMREEGYTVEETAAELGISVGYAQVLRRGKRRRTLITREECLEAVLSWVAENGRLPLSSDFADREKRGDRPSSGPVYRTLGFWEPRLERERAEVARILRDRDENQWVRHWAQTWRPRARWGDVLANIAPHIAPELVVSHRNALVRSDMMRAHGFDRVVTAIGTLLHQDDWGKLWRLDVEAAIVGEGEDGRPLYRDGEDAIVVVEVVNPTPEPDGSFKDYFLRVPPDSTTAHGAVAWTFGVEADDYFPLVQT